MMPVILKPSNKDIIVANPNNKGLPLSIDGEAVEIDQYWRKRIKDGDVVVASAPKKSKK